MFNVVGFWGELKELGQSIKTDITSNKGMWLAYSFLIIGILAIVVVNVMLISGTYSLMAVIAKSDPEFFIDNPAPLFVWGVFIYFGYDTFKEVHRAYLNLRKIIKKGNR